MLKKPRRPMTIAAAKTMPFWSFMIPQHNGREMTTM
jgi:hypothetical protein